MTVDELSDDAKTVAACLFPTIASTATFHLREHRPTERTQAALDEMVAAGLVSCEPFNRFGGKVYKPLVEFSDAKRWVTAKFLRNDMAGFNLTEPIPA